MNIISEYTRLFQNNFSSTERNYSEWIEEKENLDRVENYKELWMSKSDCKKEPFSNFSDFFEIFDIFRLISGFLRQRIEINWTRFPNPLKLSLGRGTPSAGNIYPVQIYLVSNDFGCFPAGVYEFDAERSTMRTIRIDSDATSVIADSIFDVSHAADTFLVFSSQLWRTAQRYGNLSYQLATEDAGSMLASLIWCMKEMCYSSHCHYQFHDTKIADLLGIKMPFEIPLAVISFSDLSSSRTQKYEVNIHHRQILQDHVKIKRLPLFVAQVHMASIDLPPVPPPSSIREDFFLKGKFALPPPTWEKMNILNCLLERKSYFGSQSFGRSIALEQLSNCLAFAFLPYSSDLSENSAPPSTVRLAVYIQKVYDVALGLYLYDETKHLIASSNENDPPTSRMWSGLYNLENYNLDQASAIVAIVSRTSINIANWGLRALRCSNIESGLLAQRFQLAATANNLGTGILSGFNPSRANQIFNIDHSTECVTLLIAVSLSGVEAAFRAPFLF